MGGHALRWASLLPSLELSGLSPRQSYDRGLAESQYQEPVSVARRTHPSGDVEPYKQPILEPVAKAALTVLLGSTVILRLMAQCQLEKPAGRWGHEM